MKLETNRFYIYLHRRLDTNQVFYVGKGTGDRAYRKNKRNDRGINWQRIAYSVEYVVEIYQDNLSEPEAEDLEFYLINNPKEDWNLCNKAKKRRNILPDLQLLKEYFGYDEKSPTGLIWKKLPKWKRKRKSVNEGDPAGYLTERGYYRIYFDGSDVSVHKIVYFLNKEEYPSNLVIDHINGVRTDNRINNLRLVTKQENALNRHEHREFLDDNEVSNIYLRTDRDSIIFYCPAAQYKKVFPLSLFIHEDAAYSVARMFRNDYIKLIKEFQICL